VKYVVLEGNEQGGKTTLRKALAKIYTEAVTTREPGSTFDPYAEKIRELSFSSGDYGDGEFDPLCFQYLAIAARIHQFTTLKKTSVPTLISDRSYFSALVYFATDVAERFFRSPSEESCIRIDQLSSMAVSAFFQSAAIQNFEQLTKNLLESGAFVKPDFVFLHSIPFDVMLARRAEQTETNHYDFEPAEKWCNREFLYSYYLEYHPYFRMPADKIEILLTDKISEDEMVEKAVFKLAEVCSARS